MLRCRRSSLRRLGIESCEKLQDTLVVYEIARESVLPLRILGANDSQEKLMKLTHKCDGLTALLQIVLIVTY